MMSVEDLMAYRRKHRGRIPPITLSPQHFDLVVRELAESYAVREHFALEQLLPDAALIEYQWQRTLERGLRFGRITLCGVVLKRATR